MINTREKFALQKTVKNGLGKISDTAISLREKFNIQREIKTALAKLNGNTAGTPQKSLLEQFLNFEFTKATIEKMTGVLKQIEEEIKDNIQSIVGPVAQFIEWHLSQDSGQVMESANVEDLNRLLNYIACGGKGTITINLG